MAGFWDELRAITEAEAQRGNEAFARGANIVNMLNQTTESGLNRAMDYENMAQSGLLSMANLAENRWQFDTGHKNAMELKDIEHEHDVVIDGLRHKYDMDLQNAKSKQEMDKLAETLEFDVRMANKAYQDQVLLLREQKELGFTTPQPFTPYNPVYRTMMGGRE
jgi:methyltransferase-like protein